MLCGETIIIIAMNNTFVTEVEKDLVSTKILRVYYTIYYRN